MIVAVQMVVVVGKDPDEVVYFELWHGFHDKFAVVAEKEEASAGTSSFSCILNLFDILWRLQRFENVIIFDIVKKSDFLKGFRGILSYYDSSI